MALTTVQSGLLGSDAQYTGFKNKIINGAMQVWQRGTSYAVTGSFAYGSVDRWAFAMASPAAATASQVASGVPGFQYALKLGRNASSSATGSYYAAHVLENANTYPLQGQRVTLSFWAKAGANFSAANNYLGVTINTGAGSVDGGSLSATFGGWTGNAQPYSNAVSLTTSWTRYTATCNLGSDITNLGVLFAVTPTGTAGADDSVYITGVQLETGPTATAFDNRPYGTELALCQRYYQICGQGATGRTASGTQAEVASSFATSMRASPTMSFGGFAGANTIVGQFGVGNITASGLATSISGINGFYVVPTVSGGTPGAISAILLGDMFSASAEL